MSPIITHSSIAFTPENASADNEVHPEILWDMRVSPSHAVLASTAQLIPSDILTAAATSPPLRVFKITSGLFHSKNWDIEVHNQYGVTISDILNGMYHSLRHRITKKEWAGLSHQQQAFTADAFYLRARSHPYPQHEHAQGVRRIDWLLGNTTFVGLTPIDEAPYNWRLTTKRSK